MKVDDYGRIILDEMDLCHLYMIDPQKNEMEYLVQEEIVIHPDLELPNPPVFKLVSNADLSLREFDEIQQAEWAMPKEYLDLDIAEWVLNKCTTDPERQRVGQELLLYLDRNLFPLLQYLKYLVDTMRKYNIVWGVGRGSSVSSYVLYLIGVHKVDSMYYGLEIDEFLR